MPNSASPFTDAMHLVSVVCRGTGTYATDAHGRTVQMDMSQVRALERRIYGFIGEDGPSYHVSGMHFDRRDMLSLLYQIAALIYLNRGVLGIPETSFPHRRLVREGMLILKKLDSCESAFPMFILACEANDDERRLEVLDIFSKTLNEDKRRSNHVSIIQSMVMAVWNQNDLNIDSNVSYNDTLDAVISTMPLIPLFA